MCFNNIMNTPIKKKLGTGNPRINLKRTDIKTPTWDFEVEGSGQRKRYLRSLKDKTAAQYIAFELKLVYPKLTLLTFLLTIRFQNISIID